jgi:phage tail-like protein
VTVTTSAIRVARPLVELLPGVLQEDELTQRITAGLDDVVAPVYACLDALDAYIDPELCPEDFLPWLASWVGVTVDENWPVEKQRAFVQAAVPLFQWRGTVRGLREELEVLTGGTVEVVETGGVTFSEAPLPALPGDDHPRCAVRVTLPKDSTMSDRSIHLIVEAALPAHVVHAIEITRES